MLWWRDTAACNLFKTGLILFQSRASTLSISEMKEFVQKNLKDIQTQSKAISMHIGAAEVIQVQ